MSSKVFKIVYLLFIVTLFLFYILSLNEIIYFGNELSNELTRIEIVIGIVISVPVFILLNRMHSEEFSAQFLRFLLIVLMAGTIAFILSDVSFHKSFG